MPKMTLTSTITRAVLLAAGLLASLGHCLPYADGGPVKNLTPENLNAFIKESGVVAIEYYAPWCGHCKVSTGDLRGRGAAGRPTRGARPRPAIGFGGGGWGLRRMPARPLERL